MNACIADMFVDTTIVHLGLAGSFLLLSDFIVVGVLTRFSLACAGTKASTRSEYYIKLSILLETNCWLVVSSTSYYYIS